MRMILTPDVVRFVILALACFLAIGAALLLLAGALLRSGQRAFTLGKVGRGHRPQHRRCPRRSRPRVRHGRKPCPSGQLSAFDLKDS